MPLFRTQNRFEQVFHTYSEDLWRFARYLGSSHCEAEELLQQTWLRAWEGFRTLKRMDKARAWLFTILHREFLRLRRRSPAHEPLDEARPLPDMRRESPGLQMDLERAIRDLPELFRTPLLMQIAGGLSIDEIAGILGIPRGTVLSRIARARKRLIAAHPRTTWTVYSNEQRSS
ncbi:MAG TPA: sigma-70 family RNA polymerase sigma factor [Gammaproteobacteria bacterium]|nr:sigma-70 family RNA polymerase sigma factor [Gammaproteobacteria bacterium]